MDFDQYYLQDEPLHMSLPLKDTIRCYQKDQSIQPWFYSQKHRLTYKGEKHNQKQKKNYRSTIKALKYRLATQSKLHDDDQKSMHCTKRHKTHVSQYSHSSNIHSITKMQKSPKYCNQQQFVIQDISTNEQSNESHIPFKSVYLAHFKYKTMKIEQHQIPKITLQKLNQNSIVINKLKVISNTKNDNMYKMPIGNLPTIKKAQTNYAKILSLSRQTIANNWNLTKQRRHFLIT